MKPPGHIELSAELRRGAVLGRQFPRPDEIVGYGPSREIQNHPTAFGKRCFHLWCGFLVFPM